MKAFLQGVAYIFPLYTMGSQPGSVSSFETAFEPPRDIPLSTLLCLPSYYHLCEVSFS